VVIDTTGPAPPTASPASFFAYDSSFSGGVRVSSLSNSSSIMLLSPGPGGPGVAKTMILSGGAVVDTMFGAVPFNFSTLGLFPAQ
jgi:hypothetical protein